MAEFWQYDGVTFSVPDPLPVEIPDPNGGPEYTGGKAQQYVDWVNYFASMKGIAANQISTQAKIDIANKVNQLYGRAANATVGGELTSADHGVAKGGDTFEYDDYGIGVAVDDFHDNLEEVSQERIDQAVDVAGEIPGALTSAAEYVGELAAKPLTGLAKELFNFKTLAIIGVGLVGLYLVVQLKPKAL